MRPTLPAIATLILFHSTPSHAQAKTETQPWSASVTGGFSDYAGDKARPFGSASLSRDIGNWSLGLTASIADSGEPQQRIGAIRSTTQQLILSAGYTTGSVSIDAHGAIGHRKFDDNAFTRSSGVSGMLASSGKSLSFGGSVTDDIAIGGATFFSPFVSVDYDRVDVARIITLPTRSFVLQERESGVTGAAGATLITALGRDQRHNVGLYAAVYTTSNNAASSIGLRGAGAGPRSLEGTGGKDSWFETGPTASIGVTRSLHLDLAATRTFGLKAGDGTTGSATIRLSF